MNYTLLWHLDINWKLLPRHVGGILLISTYCHFATRAWHVNGKVFSFLFSWFVLRLKSRSNIGQTARWAFGYTRYAYKSKVAHGIGQYFLDALSFISVARGMKKIQKREWVVINLVCLCIESQGKQFLKGVRALKSVLWIENCLN